MAALHVPRQPAPPVQVAANAAKLQLVIAPDVDPVQHQQVAVDDVGGVGHKSDEELVPPAP